MNDDFQQQRSDAIERMGRDRALREESHQWIARTAEYGYSYNFSWMGRPVIQFPQDLLALQEIIYRVRPRAIVETGVARGGSLTFFASMLELLGGDGIAVGVEIDLRAHNREAIDGHALAHRMTIVDGSSIEPEVAGRVRAAIGERQPVMVVLDSNHTHEHVRRELELYSPLVGPGSYLCVMDTVVDAMPPDMFPDRPWGPGDNPATAVREFLRANPRFEVDQELDQKLLITVAPGGYLRCVA